MGVSVMLLVLLSAALHATWNGLVKGGTDRFFDTAGILLGASVIAIITLPLLHMPAPACWPYLGISAVIHAAYFAMIAASYHRGQMSVVYPIMRGTAPMLTAIGSALVVHEHPSFTGWMGALLVSIGVVTFAFEKRELDAGYLIPIGLALANAVLIALYTLVDGVGVRLSHQPVSYTCDGFVLCTLIFLPLVAGSRKHRAFSHLTKQWRLGLIGGGCSLAAYTMALWAMTRAPIASVAALRETAILFGVAIAGYKLKERISLVRVLACALVVAGAVIIKLS